jgi:hypothetical protein
VVSGLCSHGKEDEMAVLEYDERVGLESLLAAARESHLLKSRNLEQKFRDKRLRGSNAPTVCWSEQLVALPSIPPRCGRKHIGTQRRGWVVLSDDGDKLLRVRTLTQGCFEFVLVVSNIQQLELLFDVIKEQLD